MTTVEIRGLGAVSSISLGVADHGTNLAQADATKLVAQYLEAGGNFIDTAHCYAEWVEGCGGNSERSIGQTLRELGAREKVVLATKGGHEPFMTYARPDMFLAPEVIAADLRESLERLQLDSVDLYYLHRDDPRVPVDELIDFLEYQAAQKRIKAYAASNWTISRLREAHAYAQATGKQGFVALQSQWSLAEPHWKPRPTDPTVRSLSVEQSLDAGDLGLALVAYSATATGYFSGDGTGHPYDSESNQAILGRAKLLAFEKGVTPTQVALGWLLAQPVPTVALIGTKSAAHLAEAMETRVSLTDSERYWLLNG